jgi:hypothetical protein
MTDQQYALRIGVRARTDLGRQGRPDRRCTLEAQFAPCVGAALERPRASTRLAVMLGNRRFTLTHHGFCCFAHPGSDRQVRPSALQSAAQLAGSRPRYQSCGGRKPYGSWWRIPPTDERHIQ